MKSSSKNLTPLLISTGVITITIALYFLKLPFLEFMELKTYDLRFISRGPLKPRGEIALIVIDEKSLDELGRWPWPRSLLAELIDKLKGCKA